MKSRISIEVDFNNNNQPVIQILQASSDDVRDRLLSHFTQQFNGSSWCQIRWQDPTGSPDGFSRIFITPIKNSELKEQSEIMAEQLRVYEDFLEKQDYNMEHYHKTGELKYKIHSQG